MSEDPQKPPKVRPGGRPLRRARQAAAANMPDLEATPEGFVEKPVNNRGKDNDGGPAAQKAVMLAGLRNDQVVAALEPFKKTGTRRPKETDLPAIFELIASGKSLRQSCNTLGFDPGDTVRCIKRAADPAVQESYEIAREMAAEARFDRMAQIAEAVIAKKITPDVARVYAEIEKWQLSKMQPKKFGDKLTQELTGADGGPIQSQQAVVVVVQDNGRPRTA